MARVSTCRDFPRFDGQASGFDRVASGTDFAVPIGRFADLPPAPRRPTLAEGGKVGTLMPAMFQGSPSAALPIVSGCAGCSTARTRAEARHVGR